MRTSVIVKVHEIFPLSPETLLRQEQHHVWAGEVSTKPHSLSFHNPAAATNLMAGYSWAPLPSVIRECLLTCSVAATQGMLPPWEASGALPGTSAIPPRVFTPSGSVGWPRNSNSEPSV